ncbi:MAG: hypothetical protein JSS72_13330 [Armatimonadetes bacterium]|nr:hypothetical protein [Armatimonadota bacterium]
MKNLTLILKCSLATSMLAVAALSSADTYGKVVFDGGRLVELKVDLNGHRSRHNYEPAWKIRERERILREEERERKWHEHHRRDEDRDWRDHRRDDRYDDWREDHRRDHDRGDDWRDDHRHDDRRDNRRDDDRHDDHRR